MTRRFQLKTLFTSDELADFKANFGLIRDDQETLNERIQSAFLDYVIVALTETSGTQEDNHKLYLEAIYHIDKAKKLLENQPHPAGKMAYRLSAMTDTLNKLVEGKDNFSAERAQRFMEKNLIRRLKDIWTTNSSTPFHTGGDDTGRNPRDFIATCCSAAGKAYPEIIWLNQVNIKLADILIKSIKK